MKINCVLYNSDVYDYVVALSKNRDNYYEGLEEVRNQIREMYDNDDEEEVVKINNLTEGELIDYVVDWLDTDFDDLFLNLKYCGYNDSLCVITGGFKSHPQYACYYGSNVRSIVPEIHSNLSEAISKTLRNSDGCTIKQVNGHIEVSTYNHDGSSTFKIHLLNDKGINAGDNADLNNRCYYKAIKGYIF